MHALYFLSRERGITFRRECPTCDEKRGEGKGEMDHRPQDEKWTRKRNTPQCEENNQIILQNDQWNLLGLV